MGLQGRKPFLGKKGFRPRPLHPKNLYTHPKPWSHILP